MFKILQTGKNYNKFWNTHLSLLSPFKTRKLCYRKDDRAMRAI